MPEQTQIKETAVAYPILVGTALVSATGGTGTIAYSVAAIAHDDGTADIAAMLNAEAAARGCHINGMNIARIVASPEPQAEQAVWNGNNGNGGSRSTLGPCQMEVYPYRAEWMWGVKVPGTEGFAHFSFCQTRREARAMCEAVTRVYLAHHPETQQQESAR